MYLIELLTNAGHGIGPRIATYLSLEEMLELGRACRSLLD